MRRKSWLPNKFYPGKYFWVSGIYEQLHQVNDVIDYKEKKCIVRSVHRNMGGYGYSLDPLKGSTVQLSLNLVLDS